MTVEFRHVGYAGKEQVEEYRRLFDGVRCWHCKYFDKSESLTYDECFINDKSHGYRYHLDGYCRRHSPQPGVDEEGHMDAKWPWVNGYDWCGEHVRRTR